MNQIFKYTPPDRSNTFELTFASQGDSATQKKDYTSTLLSENAEENLKHVKEIMHCDKNSDIVIRSFQWKTLNKIYHGFIALADGIASGETVNDFILKPIMQSNHLEIPRDRDLITFFGENVIPQGQISYEKKLLEMTDKINIGNAAIFLDTCDTGIIADVKSWEHRGVDTPVNEAVVQGPHEGFNEVLRCNTALIRKTINCSELIMEGVKLGKVSKTPGALAYIDGVINSSLLEEIKKSLAKFDADYVLSVFDAEKQMEQRGLISMPQIITTERPDKVCRAIIEGRAALILNGSSHVLILPSNITDIIASPEDSYLRKPYSVFIKLIRIIAVLLSLLTPGIYLALTRFHSESILTDMLITLSSARGNVPFSSLTEVIIMEVAFELIKEAGIRIPGAIGSSLGIVGGLILGQTAVSAGLVSPIVIIIVSICGIASFAIPSYPLSFAFRISRFAYIFAGAFAGIIGIICILLIQLTLVLGTKSFGVPICVPFSPKSGQHPFYDAIFNTHDLIQRPSYLNTKEEK